MAVVFSSVLAIEAGCAPDVVRAASGDFGRGLTPSAGELVGETKETST
ncbi:MAG: hypothetical protein ACLQIK_23085 [Mycobacterium sp.]